MNAKERHAYLGLKLLMVAACVAIAVATYHRWLMYGWLAGRWINPFFNQRDLPAILKALPGAMLLAALPYVVRRFWKVPMAGLIALTLLCATMSQLVLRSVCRYPLSALVGSDSTAFWAPAKVYGPGELLAHFEAIVPSLPEHVRANMPGKILLYHGLGLLTDDAGALGVGVLLLSNLGGLLLYALVKRLDGDVETAFGALLLYLYLPARIALVPILNIITPVLILGVLLLFVNYLDRGARLYLWLTGVALYALLLFEPLPFVAGLVVVGLMIGEWKQERFPPGQIAPVITWTLLGFLLMHGLLRLWLNYDIFETFFRCLADAKDFNVRARRPYAIWVVGNFKELFLGLGAANTLLLAAAARACWQRQERGRMLYYFLGVILTVVVTDLLGINRGETMRLWIFLMVLLLPPVAWFCRQSEDRSLVWVACLASMMPLAVVLGEVACVRP